MALIKYTRGHARAITANFTSREFDCKGKSCRCTVTRLDSRLVRKLQMLRRLTGQAVVINSGNRCPSHNRAVGGSSGSYHLDTKGKAADIVVRGMNPAQVAQLAQEIGFTGIGRYEGTAGHFVHVDVRPNAYYWRNTKGKDDPVGGQGGKKPVNPYKLGSKTLRRGSKGNEVCALQWVLRRFDYDCKVDGDYGPATQAAVKAFQRELLLEEDGIAGAETLTALKEVSS